MIISSSNIDLLIQFSAEGVPRDQAMTDELEILLDVLEAEATPEGLEAWVYATRNLENFPWDAATPIPYKDPENAPSKLDAQVKFAPPALFLALHRRPDLEPERDNDDIPTYDTSDNQWVTLWNALFQWSADDLKNRITTTGWKSSKQPVFAPPKLGPPPPPPEPEPEPDLAPPEPEPEPEPEP
ncbi:MAG: hypothetical protein ACPG4T_09945, partial [Nannocystaceae bacterium]